MDYRFAVIATLLALSGAVHAGYAQLNPPAGWVTGGGGHKPGTFARKPGPVSANDGKWLLKTVITDASLNVGGRAIVVPAALKLASNAPRFAAGFLFLHPGLRFAAGLAAWLASAGLVYDVVEGIWRRIDDDTVPSTGYSYFLYDVPSVHFPDMDSLCQGSVAHFQTHVPSLTFVSVSRTNDLCVAVFRRSDDSLYNHTEAISKEGCPVGWYVTPAGCLQNPSYRPIVEPEFSDTLTPKPMPETVPNELPPDFPLPTELPKINPGPSPDYNPRPFFIPQGDPVPNPNYDPNAEPSEENQPYIRPGLNVRPRPTDDAPWNVDIKPIDRPSPNDEPNPEPDMNGEPIPGDKPKEPKDVGLCDMYPDIVACAKLGQVSEVPVKSRTVPLSIQREEGFGPAEGSCPAPSDFVIMGRSMSFRWDLFCEFATGVRPVVVGMAYLLAVLAFFGLSRKGS